MEPAPRAIKPHRVVRKLAGRVLLVLGLALLASYGARWVPRAQTLAIELPRRQLGPCQLSVSWRRSGEREALGGASWTLETPPSRFIHHTTLPDGDYVVLVELSPLAGGDSGVNRTNAEKGVETTWERRVTLRTGETVLVLAPDGS